MGRPPSLASFPSGSNVGLFFLIVVLSHAICAAMKKSSRFFRRALPAAHHRDCLHDFRPVLRISSPEDVSWPWFSCVVGSSSTRRVYHHHGCHPSSPWCRTAQLRHHSHSTVIILFNHRGSYPALVLDRGCSTTSCAAMHCGCGTVRAIGLIITGCHSVSSLCPSTPWSAWVKLFRTSNSQPRLGLDARASGLLENVLLQHTTTVHARTKKESVSLVLVIFVLVHVLALVVLLGLSLQVSRSQLLVAPQFDGLTSLQIGRHDSANTKQMKRKV